MALLSRKREIPFAGPRSSEEFNRWAAEITADLYHLYQMALDHEVDLPRDYGLLVRENFFLQRRLAQLKDQLDALELSMGNQAKVLRRSFFSSDGLPAPDDLQASVDVRFGLAYAHCFESVSKVYLTDAGGNPHLPHEVQIDVYESTDPISVPDVSGLEPVEDESARHCISGDPRRYWLRDVLHPSQVDELYVAVHLRLPAVFSHTLSNALVLRPLPLYSMTLLDVWLRGSGEWFRMPTYPLTTIPQGAQPLALSELHDRLLVFPAEDVMEVMLYFKQPHWIQRDSQRQFSYGLRELGVFLMRFAPASVLRVPFHIPDPSASFEEIVSITPRRALGGPTEDHLPNLIETRLLVDGVEFALGEQLPALTKTVEVELTLKSHLNASPLLDGVEVRYFHA